MVARSPSTWPAAEASSAGAVPKRSATAPQSALPMARPPKNMSM